VTNNFHNYFAVIFPNCASIVGVVKISLLVAIVIASQALAEDARVTALIQQGDADDAKHQPSAALVSLLAAEAIEPENLGLLLRISKQYGDLVDKTKSKEDQQIYAEKALNYGRRAVTLDGKSAKAHLNLAICYGKLTDFVGNKVKMEYAKLIHDEAQRSIALDASDDYAWHVMGRWHFGVANLNGMLKALAGFVYGGGLPPASNEEAARCLKKATELAPQRMMHHAELAKVYAEMGKTDLAAQEWQNVLGIRPVDTQDENYQKEARLVLDARRPARGSGPRGVARR
jgi:tetratricopeptide (TPR) repeat protein